MDNMKHKRLQELDRSDFTIIEGEPDIRGWDVKISSGAKVGEVEELILDAQLKKVRYMVVDIKNEAGLDLKERKVLIPIGLANLDKEEDDVIVPNVRAEQVKKLPVYEEDQLTPEVERSICRALGRNFDEKKQEQNNPSKSLTADDSEEDQELYEHDYYSTDNLYKNRLQEAEAQERKDYEEGLKLWERRSRGGIIDEGRKQENRREERVDEDARMEMVRSRRKNYEERRYSREDNRDGRNHSIIDRIRNEGLK